MDTGSNSKMQSGAYRANEVNPKTNKWANTGPSNEVNGKSTTDRKAGYLTYEHRVTW